MLTVPSVYVMIKDLKQKIFHVYRNVDNELNCCHTVNQTINRRSRGTGPLAGGKVHVNEICAALSSARKS